MTETDSAPETGATRAPGDPSAGVPNAPGPAEPSAAGGSTPQPNAAGRGGPLRRLALWLFGLLTSGLLRGLGATWRIEVLGDDPRSAGVGGPARLAAVFHESMLPCAWLYRDRAYGVAVSRSRDGDLVAATLEALGYARPARGSSSRGGSAVLRQMLRGLARGRTTAVLVDGPRGPARVSKTGIVTLARLSGRPIHPVAFSARPSIRLSSWDQTLVPLPFARVVVAYGEPIDVDPEAADDDAELAVARLLDRRLSDLHFAADARLLED